MDIEYRTVVQGRQSVLGASWVALGSDRRHLEAATGIHIGVHSHRYASNAHAIATDDADRIVQAIGAAARSAPEFWSEFARRGAAAAGHVIDTARAPAGDVDDQQTPAQLLEGFADLGEAVKAMAPFVLAPRLIGEVEPEVRRELRSFYRLAVEILKDEGAAGLLRTTSATIGLRRIEEEHPEIHGRIVHHVDAYGWLRSQGADAEPMTPKDLVDRLQVIVLRWRTEDIDQLAQSTADPEPDEALGSIGILVRAEGVAIPFFGKIAGALGCSTKQVLSSSPDEIVAALSSRTPLTTDEFERRLSDGFIVERAEGALDVSVDPDPSSRPAPVLSGMTGCRGRGVGPVKVIRDERDLDRLEIGDVLVTASSTTDMMGGVTVFPTRGGGPPAVAKAIAVVADEGGLLSHAAIVCRERGIPCVLGTEHATATLQDGLVVEVDATRPNGTVLRYEAL